ncbi:MAG TPA: outer membrane beta-barrel protein [Candidatus Acidoferrales bacterium]|nr:outer membrane beta-barrel protein [Candidatus Acidoferrales bacterium]
MKRFALLCGAMLLFAGIASAQDDSKVTVFGGYSYLRFNPGNGVNGANFNGGSGSIAYNVLPWVGVVADIGGYHWGGSSSEGVTGSTAVSYLFGPKVSYHAGPIVPFVHALFGGVHGSISGSTCVPPPDSRVRPEGCTTQSETFSDNVFGMALGGGVDWNATPHIGVRLVQAEYVLTKFNANFAGSTSQNNVRISTGVTFRF